MRKNKHYLFVEHKEHITYSFNNNCVHQTKWSRWWADNFTSKWILTKMCTGCKLIRYNFDNAEFCIYMKILCKQIFLWQYFLCFIANSGTFCISKKYIIKCIPFNFRYTPRWRWAKWIKRWPNYNYFPDQVQAHKCGRWYYMGLWGWASSPTKSSTTYSCTFIRST